MMTSIKRNELNLRKKIQLAEEDNIGKTKVASILKRKAEYLAAFEENRQGNKKRHCNSNECNIIHNCYVGLVSIRSLNEYTDLRSHDSRKSVIICNISRYT